MLIQNPPVQVAERLWMLGTNAFPLYLYRDDQQGQTIFEGAVSAMGPVLDAQLQSLGVTADQVRQVVVTHAHPDHVMAIPLFRRMFPHVSVIASEPAAKTLQIEKAVAFFGKLDGALTRWLVERGLVDEAGQQALPADKQIAVDRSVRDGDRIEVAPGVAFQVLETPGHSVCSLSFHEPREKILIISDATGYYMPEQDFLWPGYFTSYSDYLRSIARLAALDAEVLCLSHNAVFRGATEVADYFRRVIADTEQYHRRIVTQVKSGASVQSIAAELGADVFERTGQLTVDFFQKNCTLLVTNSLQHEGIECPS